MNPGPPYHMYDAIRAQPEALRVALRENADAVTDAARRLRAMDRVVLSGIGSSWHASLAGELLLATTGGLGHRARAVHAFELARYWPPSTSGTGLVVVSHRGGPGRPSQTTTGSADASARGGVTIAVTGKGSDLPAMDVMLRTVPQEASGAHTVSYTCALALLAALAAELGEAVRFREALDAIPESLALVLRQRRWDALAAPFADRRSYYAVGGGPNTATAYEAALKLNEASQATAIGLHAEQFLHGPWVALDARDALIVIAPPGPSYDRCLAGVRVAREVGTPVLAIVADADRDIAPLATETVTMPALDEGLWPLLAVVPLQLFAYHIALAKGVNPDTMRAGEPAYRRAGRIASS